MSTELLKRRFDADEYQRMGRAGILAEDDRVELEDDVAAEFLGDKRAGDQIGALLAGAYSLKTNRRGKADTLRSWMATQDWSGLKNEPGDTDEIRCLNHLWAAQQL